MTDPDLTNDAGEPECPTCGRTDFKSVRGMKRHHALKHDESLSVVELECGYCGETYEKRADREERSEFCSEACHSSWREEEWTHPAKDHVKLECEYCGESYKRPRRRVESSRFCSRECKGEWRAENLTGEDHWSWGGGGVEMECPVCGESFECYRCEQDRRRFCSRECKGEWMSENLVGESALAWEGGAPKEYGYNWYLQRKKALKRDSYICQNCSTTRSEHQTEFGTDLHVHHITPAKEFDDPEERNALQNLVTLCADCHGLAERVAPLYPFGERATTN